MKKDLGEDSEKSQTTPMWTPKWSQHGNNMNHKDSLDGAPNQLDEQSLEVTIW